MTIICNTQGGFGNHMLVYMLACILNDKMKTIGKVTSPKKSIEVSFIIEIAEYTCSVVSSISPSPNL